MSFLAQVEPNRACYLPLIRCACVEKTVKLCNWLKPVSGLDVQAPECVEDDPCRQL